MEGFGTRGSDVSALGHRHVGRRVLTVLLIGALTATMPAGCASSSHTDATATEAVAVLPRFDAVPVGPIGTGASSRLQLVLDRAVREGACTAALASVMTLAGGWSGAAGVTGSDGGPARPTDVVPLAETSRTFTAALVLRLAVEHRMALDAPLASYLDQPAAGASNGATVRQALALRAGLPDFPDTARQRLTEEPASPPSRDRVDAAIPLAITAPGGYASASDPTYVLLARAAERAGGRPYAELVQQELVAPTGVSGILVAQSPTSRTPGRWLLPGGPGSWGAGGSIPSAADAALSSGAASMAGDLPTLVEWTWHLLHGRLLPASAIDAMARTDEEGLGSGLDRLPPPLPDGALGHIGSRRGMTTLLVIVPSRRIVLAVALSAEHAPVERIGDALLQALQ